MEGNLNHGKPPSQGDPSMEAGSCRRTEIWTSCETSGLTGDNPRGAHVQDAEMDNLVTGSLFTEWTDEKHSLYLNSMEELFVKQLNDYKSCSNSKNESLNQNSRVTSGQFKVFRDGGWQKINFERPQPQPNVKNVATQHHTLSKNPWIQHFKCADKQGEVESAIPGVKASQFNQAVPLGKTSRTPCGRVTSPKLLPACQPQFLYQDPVGINTEVSDQNFIEEDHDREKISMCRTKRTKRKKIAADVSSKDQVA